MGGRSSRKKNAIIHDLVQEATSLASRNNSHQVTSHRVSDSSQASSLRHILISEMRKQTLRDWPKDTWPPRVKADPSPVPQAAKSSCFSLHPPRLSFFLTCVSGRTDKPFLYWNRPKVIARATPPQHTHHLHRDTAQAHGAKGRSRVGGLGISWPRRAWQTSWSSSIHVRDFALCRQGWWVPGTPSALDPPNPRF